jgi:hypothetical protein
LWFFRNLDNRVKINLISQKRKYEANNSFCE